MTFYNQDQTPSSRASRESFAISGILDGTQKTMATQSNFHSEYR